MVTVRWSDLNLELCYKGTLEDLCAPELQDITACTPGFVPLGLYGFALGQFSEVLVFGTSFAARVPNATIMIGSVEATVGSPTPLFRHLMWRYHEDDLHLDLDETSTLRIWGATPDTAEAHVLTACRHLRDDADTECSLWSLDCGYPEDPEPIEAPISLRRPSVISDIEPLRLYYSGLVEPEDILAVLHFYRSLEYYSIISKVGDVTALRTRTDLSPKAFLVEITKSLGGDERADLCRLLGRLADAAIHADAHGHGLVTEATASALGNALYDFRNSIVHAKYDHRASLLVPSVFSRLERLHQWRLLLKRLAAKAMDTLGTRVGG